MKLKLTLPLVIIRLNYNKRHYAFQALKLNTNYLIKVKFENAININNNSNI
jgi:hypothetical protein